jgi:hypothetical protein
MATDIPRRWTSYGPSKQFGALTPVACAAQPRRDDHPACFMIADAVRYMSVHSWTQPDSHGRSGTW